MLLFFLASNNIFLTILIFLNNNLLDFLPASTESFQSTPSFKKQSPQIFSASIYQPTFRREKIGLPLIRRVSKNLWPFLFCDVCQLIKTQERKPLLSTFCLGHILTLPLASPWSSPKSRDRKMRSSISRKN